MGMNENVWWNIVSVWVQGSKGRDQDAFTDFDGRAGVQRNSKFLHRRVI